MTTQEKYDNRYKWLFVEVADEYCVQCPKCGYTAQVHIIKELVSGHYLSPHCPNCGENLTEPEEVSEDA